MISSDHLTTQHTSTLDIYLSTACCFPASIYLEMLTIRSDNITYLLILLQTEKLNGSKVQQGVANCSKLYPGQLEHNEARIHHHVTLIRQITACPPSTGNCELQPCNTTIMQLILWRYSYYYLLNKHQISLFVPDFICSTMFAYEVL